MTKHNLVLSLFMVCLVLLPSIAIAHDSEEGSHLPDYTLSVGAGMIFYETDEEVEPGQIYQLSFGRALNDRWSIEGAVGYLPQIEDNSDPLANGGKFLLGEETWGLRLASDALYHFHVDSHRLDPFVSVGAGVMYYDEEFENEQNWDPFAAIGTGVMYDLTEKMYLRGDYRLQVTGHDTEFNHVAIAHLGFKWNSDGDKMSGAGTKAPVPMSDVDKVGDLVRIYFPFDSSRITPEAAAKLRKNAKWIKANPNVKIEIQGHCDERGTAEYNIGLGERRANSAKKFLVTLGIDESRLETVSYGEERPLVEGQNEAAWAKNRRAECIPIK